MAERVFSLHHVDPAIDADPEVRRYLDLVLDLIHDEAVAEADRVFTELLVYGRSPAPAPEPAP